MSQNPHFIADDDFFGLDPCPIGAPTAEWSPYYDPDEIKDLDEEYPEAWLSSRSRYTRTPSPPSTPHPGPSSQRRPLVAQLSISSSFSDFEDDDEQRPGEANGALPAGIREYFEPRKAPSRNSLPTISEYAEGLEEHDYEVIKAKKLGVPICFAPSVCEPVRPSCMLFTSFDSVHCL